MPLTAKGEEILANLEKEYGPKHGKEVLYAGKNKGTFTGIDSIVDAVSCMADACEQLDRRIDAWADRRADASRRMRLMP